MIDAFVPTGLVVKTIDEQCHDLRYTTPKCRSLFADGVLSSSADLSGTPE